MSILSFFLLPNILIFGNIQVQVYNITITAAGFTYEVSYSKIVTVTSSFQLFPVLIEDDRPPKNNFQIFY